MQDDDEEDDFGGGDAPEPEGEGQQFPLDPSKGPPKSIKFFGEVWDEFSPSLKNKYKNYLTKAVIFLIEGHGFYAQAVMSTCKMANGMFDVVHKIYPIKIDIDKKAFLIIEQSGPRTMQECMKVENIESFIDKVITVVTGEPIGEIKFQMADHEDPNQADWWKGKTPNDPQEDPNWWKKGGDNPLGDPV